MAKQFFMVKNNLSISADRFILEKGSIFYLEGFIRYGSSTKDIYFLSGKVKFTTRVDELLRFYKNHDNVSLTIKNYNHFYSIKEMDSIFKDTKLNINTLLNRSVIYLNDRDIIPISEDNINSVDHILNVDDIKIRSFKEKQKELNQKKTISLNIKESTFSKHLSMSLESLVIE